MENKGGERNILEFPLLPWPQRSILGGLSIPSNINIYWGGKKGTEKKNRDT